MPSGGCSHLTVCSGRSQTSPRSPGSRCQLVGSGDSKLTKVHIGFRATFFVSPCLGMQDRGGFTASPPLFWVCCTGRTIGVLVAPAGATLPILNFGAGNRQHLGSPQGISTVGKPSPSPCLLCTPGYKDLHKSLRGQSKGISKVIITRKRNPDERD